MLKNETSIGSITHGDNNNAKIYTLDGRIADSNKLKRGIYIKDGKKFYVK